MAAARLTLGLMSLGQAIQTTLTSKVREMCLKHHHIIIYIYILYIPGKEKNIAMELTHLLDYLPINCDFS